MSLGGDVAQLVRASDHHAADAGSIPQCGTGFFSQSTFGEDSLRCVRTSPCAIACINICAHVKDPVVRVRVRWNMETLKHPACTLGLVVWLCRSWLSPGKATRISHGRNPTGTIRYSWASKCLCVPACRWSQRVSGAGSRRPSIF